MDNELPRRLGSYADGARIAKTTPFTVGRWGREGKLSVYRVGTRTRIDLDELAEFLAPVQINTK